LCIRVYGDRYDETIEGISLLDGGIGVCSARYCAPRKITKNTAILSREFGPRSKTVRENLKSFYASEWGNGRKIWWKE
jgi:hypothetical protein